jgi:LacI family transcriptional regulator
LGALQRRKRDNLPKRHLTFLMQQSHRPLYQMWADGIKSAAERRLDAVVEPHIVFEDDLTPEAVSSKLLKIGEAADAIAVVTADHPLVSQAIDELRTKGVPVIAYVTDLSAASRAGFVGTDNWKRGRTAAWFMNKTIKGAGKIFPLVGSNRYQCQDMADASFRNSVLMGVRTTPHDILAAKPPLPSETYSKNGWSSKNHMIMRYL